MPLVSVIMPYYKKINFVINAINSVLNQSFQNFELILIYDDTNLSDLEIIKNEFKNNTKLKIIKIKKILELEYLEISEYHNQWVK